MTTRPRAFATDEPLAESWFAQHELEDLLALPEDFVPVGDEEEGVTLSFFAQSLEVEGRDPCLAGSGGSDDEIAAMLALALRLKRLERHGLMGLRCDVHQQRNIEAVVRQAPVTLPGQCAVEPFGVASGFVVLELRLLPVLLERRREAFDDLGILRRAHAHIPFEPVDLRRVGEVRRADVGRVQSAIAMEQPRLGVEPRSRNLIGDLDSRAERDQCIEGTSLGRAGVDARNHSDPRAGACPCFELGPEQSQPRVTHERAQEIDSIGARDFSCDLARDLDIASSVDEKAGSAEGEGRAGERRRRVAQPDTVGGLDEQLRSLRDPIVRQGAVLEERFHQPIRKRDLGRNLRVSIPADRFQRATKEFVYVAGQELGAGCGVGRVNVNTPAILASGVDLRLQSGGDHVLVDAGTESVRHEGSRHNLVRMSVTPGPSSRISKWASSDAT